MTWIIYGVPTKKALKEAVKEGRLNAIRLENPSFFESNPFCGTLKELVEDSERTGVKVIVVTNHPKRSWFAQIKIVGDKVVVS